MLPLQGFRVLDLTRFLSGPYCTMVLAEFGADVVKIEQPGTGDDSRRMAPKVNGESYPFAMPNRSKRSVSLDLKSERGKQLFLELAKDADLVIVVGSGNSSNSVRLVEVALEAGAAAAHRVDDAGEIDERWLEGVRTVSVTSGASVPDDLVEGVLAFLAEHGYPDAKAVKTAEESLIFALPPELRRDMRAAARAGG